MVIVVVAIIVVGPKDLPGMLRSIGKTIGSVKRMANDFQRQFNDALKESELDEITDLAKNKTFAPLEDAKKSMEEFQSSVMDPIDADEWDPEGDPEALVAQTTPAAKPTKTAAKEEKSKPEVKKAAPRKTTAKKVASKTSTSTAKKPVARKTATKTTRAKPAAAKTTKSTT